MSVEKSELVKARVRKYFLKNRELLAARKRAARLVNGEIAVTKNSLTFLLGW